MHIFVYLYIDSKTTKDSAEGKKEEEGMTSLANALFITRRSNGQFEFSRANYLLSLYRTFDSRL